MKICKNCYLPSENWNFPPSTLRRRVYCSRKCFLQHRNRYTPKQEPPHYSREEWKQKWAIYHLRPTRENLSKILEEMTKEDFGKIKNIRA